MSSPENTHAIVVGVGRYDRDELTALHAPVEDAIRFAHWLRSERGLPAKNIHLFLSRTASNTQPVPAGVVEQPATRAAIGAAIEGLARVPGELLWFFWGGHGMIPRDRSLRLLYQDANAGNWLNLHLQGLMTALRTNRFPAPHWRRQIFVVDACRNFGWQHDGQRKIPLEEFAEGATEVDGREQFAIFAARPGEYAYEEARHGWAGDLSRSLLALLKQAPPTPWPPDMEALMRRLAEQFVALRAAGKAEQTPAFLWNRDWATNEKTFGDLQIAGPLQPAVGPLAKVEGASPAEGLRSHPPRSDPPLPTPTVDDLELLLEALLACPCMTDPQARQDVRQQLRPAIATAIPFRPDDRGHVLNILRMCLRHPHGVAELVDQIRLQDGKQPPVEALMKTVRRILPNELNAPP